MLFLIAFETMFIANRHVVLVSTKKSYSYEYKKNVTILRISHLKDQYSADGYFWALLFSSICHLLHFFSVFLLHDKRWASTKCSRALTILDKNANLSE